MGSVQVTQAYAVHILHHSDRSPRATNRRPEYWKCSIHVQTIGAHGTFYASRLALRTGPIAILLIHSAGLLVGATACVYTSLRLGCRLHVFPRFPLLTSSSSCFHIIPQCLTIKAAHLISQSRALIWSKFGARILKIHETRMN